MADVAQDTLAAEVAAAEATVMAAEADSTIQHKYNINTIH